MAFGGIIGQTPDVILPDFPTFEEETIINYSPIKNEVFFKANGWSVEINGNLNFDNTKKQIYYKNMSDAVCYGKISNNEIRNTDSSITVAQLVTFNDINKTFLRIKTIDSPIRNTNFNSYFWKIVNDNFYLIARYSDSSVKVYKKDLNEDSRTMTLLSSYNGIQGIGNKPLNTKAIMFEPTEKKIVYFDFEKETFFETGSLSGNTTLNIAQTDYQISENKDGFFIINSYFQGNNEGYYFSYDKIQAKRLTGGGGKYQAVGDYWTGDIMQLKCTTSNFNQDKDIQTLIYNTKENSASFAPKLNSYNSLMITINGKMIWAASEYANNIFIPQNNYKSYVKIAGSFIKLEFIYNSENNTINITYPTIPDYKYYNINLGNKKLFESKYGINVKVPTDKIVLDSKVIINKQFYENVSDVYNWYIALNK